MKIIFSFLVLANTALCQTWTQLTDFPANQRDDGLATVINNFAYVGTGLADISGISNDFQRLDLTTNTWSGIASMPAGSNRQYACAFTYSNYLFVTCGITNGNVVLNDSYRYDVITNTWITVAAKPGNGIWGASSFTIASKAYLFGGKFSNGNVSDEVWEYDMINNTWTQKNNFLFGGRWRASSAVLNNNPYVTFGLDNNGSYRKEIYRYAQITDSWIKVSEFPQPKGRVYAAMQALQNKLILFGGHDSTGLYFNDVWFFDEANGFTQGPSIPSIARKGGMSFSNGNKFYYTCGLSAGQLRLKETWMLDVPVGILEYSIINNSFVYPNPFINEVTIFLLNNDEQVRIEIINLLGESIFKTTAMADLKLDVSSLNKGIYFLRINYDSYSEIKKIIKE